MREKAFSIVIGIMTAVLYFLPTGFENPSLTESALYEKGTVLATDNSDLRFFSIITTGTQDLVLKIESGRFAGDTVAAKNVLLGQKKLDKIFRPEDKVLTVIQLDKSREHYTGVRAADYYRQDLEILLFICFALFLVLFFKFTGLKAILSFVFTAFVFWKLLIPLFLKGYSPLLTATGIVFLCTTIIILLVGGVNRKGLVALLGTIAGVSVTALLAVVFGYYFKIPGTIQEFSEALLYTGFVSLDFSDIFISVIFVSSAGAVMDVAMDISAALHELSSRMPELQRKELIKSGFRIASPVIGSMTTTLLFAYSGSFMFAFMAFMVKGTSVQSILNSGYIAAEILHTLVGSFGLVLVGPLTAAIGGYVYSLNGSCNRTVTTTFQSRNFPVLLLLCEKINKNKFKRLRR